MHKNIRIAVASFVMLFCVIYFGGQGTQLVRVMNPVLDLQFYPLLVRTGVLSLGFMGLVALTLIFGRLYCSFFCPLGILQDIFIFSLKKYPGTGHLSLREKRILSVINLLIMFLLFISILAGTRVLVYALDPYSIFGRMMINLAFPIVALIRNLLTSIFEHSGFYVLTPVSVHKITAGVLFLSFLSLGILLFLTGWRGRLYCNSLCPAGIFLGLLSSKSLARFSIDPEKCTSCGNCEKFCKADCISSDRKEIDCRRCVSCFNCIDNCPVKAISYGIVSKEVSPSRRAFISWISVLLWTGLLAVSGKRHSIISLIFSDRDRGPDISPVIPPGAVSLDRLLQKCTGCQLCVLKCPMKVIVPGSETKDLRRMFIPNLDYSRSFCLFECNTCTQVCPTDALVPLSLDVKKVTRLGNAVFSPERCIVHIRETACGACAEHCPTGAVYMVPVRNDLYGPEVDTAFCIGCGACENVCPALPEKAIIISPLKDHGRAEIRQDQIQNTYPGIPEEDDFPF